MPTPGGKFPFVDWLSATPGLPSPLDEKSNISTYQVVKIGIFHYNKKNFFNAIKYWRRAASWSDDPAPLCNLGLAYIQPDIAQTADAIDMWRLTLARFPEHKSAQNCLAQTLPTALVQANAARSFRDKRLLPQDQWYIHYLNPLELLNCPPDIDLDALDAKAVKSFKDKLLKEIELEDCVISWLPGARIDKSQAISTCNELNDEVELAYHWHVFRNQPLLDFLSRGGFEHFFVDESKSCIETLKLLDDEGAEFREWLSEPFAKQYDLVLSKAIELKDPALITVLLGGRRWVASSFADKCFQNTLRQIDRLLQPLREAGEDAAQAKPSAASVKTLLEQDMLLHLLNTLPVYFRGYQDEAAQLIRDIAHNSYAKHSDIDLAKAILEISNELRKLSPNMRGYIEDDFAKIEKIIQKERESEARLTSGDSQWQITKHGVLLGSQNIPADQVASLSWGTFITRKSNGIPIYDFLLAVKDINGAEIRYGWQTSRDIEENQKCFGLLVDAALNHLFPVVVERMDGLLKKGIPVRIGPCSITESGVAFETKGWFSASISTVPWQRLGSSIENGDLIVFDKASPKIKTRMGLRNTENATVLRLLAQRRNPTEE